jgi:hypothetical protein
MSAFAVKVSSDKQTLILAGEAGPPARPNWGDVGAYRSAMGVQLQRVTVLVMQGDYAASTLPADSSPAKSLVAPSERVLPPSAIALDAPTVPAQFVVPYRSSSRAQSGAAEYARTQNLSGNRTSQFIDTYA